MEQETTGQENLQIRPVHVHTGLTDHMCTVAVSQLDQTSPTTNLRSDEDEGKGLPWSWATAKGKKGGTDAVSSLLGQSESCPVVPFRQSRIKQSPSKALILTHQREIQRRTFGESPSQIKHKPQILLPRAKVQMWRYKISAGRNP